MSNKTMPRSLVTLLFVTLLVPLSAIAANIYVYPGDNLNAKIAGAQGGDTVFVHPGTYAPINMANRHFSGAAPLVIRGLVNPDQVIIQHASNFSKEALVVENCRYVVFRSLTFKKGQRVAAIKDCQNIIIKNCTFTEPYQEGLHIYTSHYVDVLYCKIYKTGQPYTDPEGTVYDTSKWAEGIYVGKGLERNINTRIWIEGCEIYNTGKAEGVNFKLGVSESTIKGCHISNISPGTPTQVNEAAISIEAYEENAPLLTFAQNNWVEGNHVHHVSGGQPGKNRGIMTFASGVMVKNNHVHHCADEGIRVSSWKNPGFTNRIYGNWVHDTNGGIKIDSGVTVSTADPGPNPFSPQTWYN